MRTIKYFGLLFLILISFKSQASHFAGYDISITRIAGGDTYKVRFTIFKDASPSSAAMPTSMNFTTYVNGTNANANVSFTTPRVNMYIATYDPKDCPPPGSNLTLQVGVFEYTLTATQALSLNNANGYYLSASECCRNDGATNVLGSSGLGMNFTIDFPRLSSTAATRYNSTPRYAKAPLAFYCVGKPYTIDWQPSDPDGDSLVFGLIPPSDGTSQVKPFGVATYAPGYNINYNIMDGVPDLTVNPRTGVINFIPTRTGRYLVGFKVEEWRKISGVWTKIGTMFREFQLETVICPEAPPVTEDNNNQKKVIVDTVNYPDEYTITFTSRDSPSDSIFMYMIPNLQDNLLDPNLFQGKWGEIGNLSSGQTAQNLIISGIGVVNGQFKWKPNCKDHVREAPYKFTVVVRDQTCPSPFYDSTFVTLYVRKKENHKPMFVNKYHNQGDTILTSSNINKKTKRYFVNAGEKFQLAADSIIKTYDYDSTQVVNMIMIQDFAHNPRFTQNMPSFNVNQAPVHTTASFIWQTTCLDRNDTSYLFKIIAFDDDCKKRDTVDFSIEIYIRDQPNRKPRFANYSADTVYIKEGTTDSFFVAVYDTANSYFNKYRHIQLIPDLTDFAYMSTQGGNMIQYSKLDGPDSLKVKFTWSPNCANVRPEPYKLYMRTVDEACPTLTSYDTVYVFAAGPYNSAPEFRDKNDIAYSIVDTTIYGGDVFDFNMFAVDTNQRFDSVYITLDQTSEITNPTIVQNIAYLIPTFGKDSARANLHWTTTCSDIRTTPYVARVVARDNECVNPEKNILTFNITVRERPNFLPKFTFTNLPMTVDTIYAGQTYNVNLTVLDTTTGEFITLDSISTNIPYNLPKPVINRAFGLGKDTVKTNLSWFADCSLIRDEPYYINIASWDGACRNPQDSARHVFKLYIFRNPDLAPNFTSGKDTVIELVAGEKFHLDLNSVSIMPGDSVGIFTSGDVYGGIPGNLAKFEQTNATGEGNAIFSWETSCDQIRDSAYTVFFTTSNPPCKTPEEGFRIKFKVIPNTDLTNPIPNVFSPNGDKINDTYSIINQYKVYCDPGFKFTIFNRWGKIVFESTDPAFDWDAEGLGAGTYFYTLESRARSQNGTIDIIK